MRYVRSAISSVSHVMEEPTMMFSPAWPAQQALCGWAPSWPYQWDGEVTPESMYVCRKCREACDER